jgi:tetratricopeptide (TPR) repeat protein
VWLLLPFNPDWRWLLEREDSPWYPAMRLFRQPSLGDWAGVIARIAQALAPDLSALWPQALDLHQQGRLAEAQALYREVLRHAPGHFDALHMLGVATLQAGETRQGIALIGQALALEPNHADAHSNLGNGWLDLGRPEEALACYERALALNPDHADALNNRGNALQALKRPAEALASYEQALRLKPAQADTLANCGNALLDLDRPGDALACYDQALALNPGHADALINRGNALQGLTRHGEALDSYARALALRPDYAEAHWNEGLSRLVLGDFERGWAKYEWRWKKKTTVSPLRDFAQPLWLGRESLQGKTVLLHAEQGHGDTIQFCRYARHVAARGAAVLLEVQAGLKPLLAGLEGVGRVLAKGEALPDFDCHCPLLSLPLAFGTRLETIPADIPYLSADPARAALWQARLGPKTRPRVGLAWSGNSAHVNDRNRSVPLAEFARRLGGQAQWVSLQKQVREGDWEALQARRDIAHYGEALGDFADTAALLVNLDLVIAVDTAVAHLAGALGKPVWLLLPFNPDWRWLLGREDSPWYPSLRLFRQSAPGDWDGVLARVADALGRFAP